MANESTKQPLPKAADVPSVAPLVEAIGRAKVRIRRAADAATTGGTLDASAPAYRAARKRLKRAQRRLRRELVRVARAASAAPADAPASGDAG